MLREASCHIVGNSPTSWDSNQTLRNAVDFWYKAGDSSSDGVWNKKQEPVCKAAAARYLACEDDDEEDEKKDGE